MSSDVEKTKAELYNTRNKIEDKNSRLESLNLKLNNFTIDRYFVRKDNMLLVKQRNIYCNTAKYFMENTPCYIVLLSYVKNNIENYYILSLLKSKLLMKFHLIVKIGFLCLQNDSYAYSVINIYEYLDVDDLMNIVNDTLS